MRILEHIFEDGPRWIALTALLFAICFFTYGWGIWQGIGLPSVYLLFIAVGNFTVRLAIFFLPLLLLVLMLWIKLLKRRKKTSAYLNIAAIMLLSNMIMCAAAPVVMLGKYHHYDRVWLGGHTYYLGSAWKIGVGSSEPSQIAVFECDTIGLLCKVLHQQDTSGTPLEQFERINARLIADPTTSTLALEINGEVVYTYQP